MASRTGPTQPTRPTTEPEIQRAEADAKRLGAALFPVRVFLGLTFVYGGIQKLSDPGYFQPGAATYIGTQLHGFANGTPGGFLLRALAIPHPRLAGLCVALAEILIGLLATTGVLTRPAATAGLALNLLLFLTNSWHTYPYFLGSDIVFVFAWLPFVIVGAGRQPTLERAVHRLAVLVRGAMQGGRAARADQGRVSGYRPERRPSAPELTRRTTLGAALGMAAAATAAIAGLSLLSRGAYRSPRSFRASVPRRASPKASTGRPPADIAAAQPSGLPPGAVKLGPASQLPAGQGATYPDPRDGSPDIVIRQANGTLIAHSAVCTHAGCTVGYQGGQIVCPCHGAVYDAQTGAVISGPAPTPLASRKVIERGGEIYALRS